MCENSASFSLLLTKFCQRSVQGGWIVWRNRNRKVLIPLCNIVEQI